MTLGGYSVLVALPAINGAWVEQLGFSEVQVNRVASADLLGLFIGAVMTSVLIKRWDRQRLTYLGIALAILASLVSSRKCFQIPSTATLLMPQNRPTAKVCAATKSRTGPVTKSNLHSFFRQGGQNSPHPHLTQSHFCMEVLKA